MIHIIIKHMHYTVIQFLVCLKTLDTWWRPQHLKGWITNEAPTGKAEKSGDFSPYGTCIFPETSASAVCCLRLRIWVSSSEGQHEDVEKKQRGEKVWETILEILKMRNLGRKAEQRTPSVCPQDMSCNQKLYKAKD